MRTEENSEMTDVFKVIREGRRKCQCGVCGEAALEKISFYQSLLWLKTKVLKRFFLHINYSNCFFRYLSLIDRLLKISC